MLLPMLKPRTMLFSAAVLVVAGLVPVLYFAGLVAWQISALVQAGSWVPLPAMLLFTNHSLAEAGKAAPALAFIPELPWAWLMSPESWLPAHTTVTWILGRLHVGLAFAVVGLAAMALGALGAFRQVAAIRAHRQRDEDRLRRVRDYLRDGPVDSIDGRREPFISSRPAG